MSALLTTTVQDQISDVDGSKTVVNTTEIQKDLVSREKIKEMLTENAVEGRRETEDFGDNDEDEELCGIDEQDKSDPILTLQRTNTLEVTTSTNVTDDTLFKKPGTSSLPKAGDANFVSEFYNNSRLHYLSTWGAEFKKYTSDIIKSCAAKGWKCRGTGRAGPHGRVIMHIDMDSFFVSVTLRDQPHLRGKPIAVCHAGKNNSSAEQGEIWLER